MVDANSTTHQARNHIDVPNGSGASQDTRIVVQTGANSHALIDPEDLRKLPIWTAWAMLDGQGPATRLGSGMTRNEANAAARAAMDNRSDVYGTAIKRNWESAPC